MDAKHVFPDATPVRVFWRSTEYPKSSMQCFKKQQVHHCFFKTGLHTSGRREKSQRIIYLMLSILYPSWNISWEVISLGKWLWWFEILFVPFIHSVWDCELYASLPCSKLHFEHTTFCFLCDLFASLLGWHSKGKRTTEGRWLLKCNFPRA